MNTGRFVGDWNDARCHAVKASNGRIIIGVNRRVQEIEAHLDQHVPNWRDEALITDAEVVAALRIFQ